VGSFLRQDHPLLAQRLRQSARHGTKIALIHSMAQNLLMPTHGQVLCSPENWAQKLCEIAAAVCSLKSQPIPTELKLIKPDDQSRAVAELLLSSESPQSKSVILLGNSVLAHPRASEVWAAAQFLADSVGCRFGFTVEGANGVGGYLAKARPIAGGLDAAAMFANPAEAYLLCAMDPAMDCVNPHKAQQALKAAKLVVALTAFRDSVMEVADVVLPISAFTETSGTYVNCEGRMQTTQAVVKPRGESRPAWKVLRVLGNLIGAEGFDFESSEDVRRTVLGGFKAGDLIPGLGARVHGPIDQSANPTRSEFIRMADVPIYRSDSLSRHAAALQETRASASPRVLINPKDLDRLGLVSGAKMKCVQSGRASAVLELTGDDRVCPGVLQISAAHAATATLGEMIGPIGLEAV
jgi:NADH-quinone oxidoreductase subunit G